MTADDVRAIINHDTNDTLLERYTWYCTNFNPFDEAMRDDFEIIKAEILKRMQK